MRAISTDDIDRIAGSIAIILGGLSIVALEGGHRHYALWLGCATACLGFTAIIALFNERSWLPKRAVGRHWYLIGVIVLLLCVWTGITHVNLNQTIAGEEQARRLAGNRIIFVTPEVRQRLVKTLQETLPPKSVFVHINTSAWTPETSEFAKSIVGVIRESGCFLNGREGMDMPGLSGIKVLYVGEQPSAVAETLYDVLRKEEMPGLSLEVIQGPLEGGAQAVLYIGPKQ